MPNRLPSIAQEGSLFAAEPVVDDCSVSRKEKSERPYNCNQHPKCLAISRGLQAGFGMIPNCLEAFPHVGSAVRTDPRAMP